MNLGETRVDVVVDFGKAEAQARAFMASVSGKPVKIETEISDKARADAKRIMAELRAEASKKIEIPLSVKDQTAAALSSINSKLAGFSKQDRTAVLKVAAGQAESELKRINGLIAKADADDVDILVVARDKATAQLNAVNQALGKTQKEAQSTGQALRGMFGQVLAGTAFVAGIRTAIDAASDLQQAVGGVEAVFGDAAGPILEFGTKAADAIGLANDQFLSFSAIIGGALKRAGLPMDEVVAKTQQLIGVAADLAATYGGTTAEAVTALTAAFRGEFDSLERFNTGLTQSAVNAKAVSLGLAESESSVSSYARTQATLALVLEQSSDALGQNAREADTAAGQQQRAMANLRDAAASLGSALLPTFTRITGLVSSLADGFAQLPGPVQTAVVALGGIAILAGPLGNLIGLVKTLGPALATLATSPVGIGIAAAGLAATALFVTLRQGSEVAKETAANTKSISAALAEATDNALGLAAAAAKTQTITDDIAVGFKSLSDAVFGGVDAPDELRAAFGALGLDVDSASEKIIALRGNPVSSIATLTTALGLTQKEADGLNKLFAENTRVTVLNGAAIGRQTDKVVGLSDAGEKVANAYNEIRGAAETVNLQDVTKEFLNQQFAAGDLGRELVTMAEKQAGASRNSEQALNVYLRYQQILASTGHTAEQVAAGNDKLATSQRGVVDAIRGSFEGLRQGDATIQQIYASTTGLRDVLGTVAEGAKFDILRRELGLVGEEFDKAVANSRTFAQTLRSEDWQNAGFDAALSSIQAYQQETLSLINLVQDRKSAITDFRDAVKGLNFDDIAQSTPEAIKGLEGIAQVLSVDLANAWTQSQGNADAFVLRSVAATDTLIASLGLSADQADKLKTALRATEGDFRAQVDVIIANEAILKLQLLSSTLDLLKPETQVKIALQIANDDPVGALATQLAALEEQQHLVNVKVTMDTLQAEGQLDGLTLEQREATINAVASIAEATGDFDSLTDQDRQARIQAIAETVEAQGGLDDLTSEERQAIIDTIAHTTKASDSIEDVETAQYNASVAVDAALGTYNRDVAAATQPRTTKVNLDAGGVVRNVPQFVNIAARLNIPRGANIPVAQGMFNPAASSTLQAFAAGGMTWDDSQANKWGAGQSMFQIREPETGGESFIPHARSKWARSRRIWWETGKALGMIAMADGGVTSMAQQVINPYVPPTWMVDLLRRSGSSVKDFEEALKSGPEAIDILLAKLKKQGVAADEIVKIDKELIKALNILRLQALQAAAAQQQIAASGGGGGGGGGGGEDTTKADAAAELNDQLVGQAEAFESATNANFQYQIALGSADWGRSAIESAEKAFGDFTDGLFAGVDATLDRQDAMKGFFDVIASSITLAEGEEDPMGMVRIGRALQQINQSGGFSSLAGQARELNSAFKAIAETVDEQLSQAFQGANGDSAAFLVEATRIGDKVIADMQLTGEAAEAVRTQLGLTAGDYEARFKLAGADEAFKRLSLLKTSIDALNNDELSAQIDVLIAQGDFTGALQLAQDALDKNALEVKTKANTTDTEKALKALADESRVAIIEVRLDASGIPADYAAIIQAIRTGNLPIGLTTHARGGTAGPWGGIAGEMWLPEIVNGHVVSSPTYVSPGTQVTGVAATQARLRTQGAHGATGGSQGTLDYNKLAQALAQALTDPMTRSLTSAVRQMVRGA